jgi:AraC-like DNA-binding protein
VLRTQDFNAWQSALAGLLGDHRSDLLNSRFEQADLGFQAHLRAGQIGNVGVVAIAGVGRTRLDRHQAADSVVLWLPRRGWVREQINGQEHLAEPGMALLCRQGQHLRGESSARIEGLSLILPARWLQDLGLGSGARHPALIDRGPEARAVIAQVHQLATLVERPATANAGLHPEEQVQQLGEALLNWEAAATGQAEAPAAPNRSAAIVAEAEAWMTARLEQPLRIADLARALELTTRSLQLAFQRECGCSPLQRLKRLRFQALHRLLERPDHGVLSLDILFGSVGLPRHGRTRQEFGSWCGSLPSEHRRLALLRQPYPRSSTGKISVTKE